MADDFSTQRHLSQRARRALGLIAAAVTVVVVSSIVYLHPSPNANTTTLSRSSSPALVMGAGGFLAFDFVTPSLGWAFAAPTARVPTANPGQFFVFRTTDGAKHWQKQLTGQGDLSSATSGSIQFFDKDHGFVIANGPDTRSLYRTLDGGANWNPIGLPKVGIQELAFGDLRHAWLLPSRPFAGTLYVTGDGGSTWQLLPSPPVDSNGIVGRGASEAWLGSYGSGPPHVYASADGGRSWERHDLPDPRNALSGDTSVDASVRLLPGAGLVAYSYVAGIAHEFTSFDGGISWKFVPPRPGQTQGGVESFEDATHWWTLDGPILYKSSNAGQTWTEAFGQLGNRSDWEYYVEVIDSRHAWALVLMPDATGLVLTNDGGAHWTRATVPEPT